MHGPDNLRLVCGLECNSKVSRSNHPVEMEEIVITAVKRITGETDEGS